MEKLPITLNGLENLKIELKKLKTTERPKVIQAISDARALGDLSENAEYSAAREKQAFIEGRIIELEDKIARADVIDVTKLSGDKIKFGATIRLIDDDTEEEVVYQIVGETETDLALGKISYTSPLAKALIGKSINEIVEVNTPKGIKIYEVKFIEYI